VVEFMMVAMIGMRRLSHRPASLSTVAMEIAVDDDATASLPPVPVPQDA
jgi:hypothetical protein